MAEILNSLTVEEIKEIIYRELPRFLREHPEVRSFLEELLREQCADRKQTESRFEVLLGEIRELMQEIKRLREESECRWEESERRWRELKEESDRRWEESERRWQEILQEIKALHRKYDVGVGALGARWGLRAESSFREAIRGILEESFPVKVERYWARDEKGEVFGRPDQVELDLIIRNGEVIAAEIKSSVSKADVYIFERKVRFYERREGRRVKRMIIISPMVAPEALPVAQNLGIEVYTYPDYIEEL